MKPNREKEQTYDVVETAIDLSKHLHGTWERLIRGQRIKPWALENYPASSETQATPDDEQDVIVNP